MEILILRLLADQRILPAATTHEGVRPVRVETWVDLAVVTDDASKAQKQFCKHDKK